MVGTVIGISIAILVRIEILGGGIRRNAE